ncbi:M61 family metallopeptidase [Lusitaniella coriacea LEGE 07157]|uniref:M61 family metallopeptidase n=1 Tax=Lusitaniella coriacea LEGE 07157 TaxID=945747 RepID=A0A8J7IV61_9CYAN|nr:M61 family metallopeptidase [Lusitaniella coriacea]MBE9117013.1 M61 family metallopeptidase [Lusitaniella coriacea LEGE 07157]
MTNTARRDRVTPKSITTLHYQVAMPIPESHLFEVVLRVTQWQFPVLDLKMPVWTPGSYLVREYAKQVQDFTAQSSNTHQILPSRKLGKNHWQIETEATENITICYRVFANELSVRTNHLDATHGYFNGAALFFFVPAWEKQPLRVTIVPPQPDWNITTSLPAVPGEKNTFEAEDFDTLVDSPFEIGRQEIHSFEVFGKSHQLAVWGKGNINAHRIIQDTTKIIQVEANLYGNLPYDRYLFLLHLSASGFGGLEHKNSCSLNYPRLGFRKKEKYNRFMQLVAHEFFHLWNVKRIRPKALESFDYERENYTTSLWFSEGTTSYYDLLIPLWAGIYDVKAFLELLSKEITRFLTIPGRKVQPLSESSFDAWIKLYRRDANSDNSQISYYLKGEMVSLLLDLFIRNRHKNQRSLDDVMRQMWQRFGEEEIGFTPEQLKVVIETVADVDLSDFFHRYIDRADELPFDEYLEPFGLHLKPIVDDETIPYLGLRVVANNNKAMVQFVEANSPASLVGIDPGDELLAIDGLRVTAEQFRDRLQDYQAGDMIEVALFHQEELQTHRIQLAEPQPTRYQVVKSKSITREQKELLIGWLRTRL